MDKVRKLTIIVNGKDGGKVSQTCFIYANGVWESQTINLNGDVEGSVSSNFDGKEPINIEAKLKDDSVTLKKISSDIRNGKIEDNDENLATNHSVKEYTDSIMNGVDDWIDISNEWEFLNSFTDIYNDAGTNTHTFQALYSPSRKQVSIPSSVRIHRTGTALMQDSITNTWIRFMRYVGNRFYTTENYEDVGQSPMMATTNGLSLFNGSDKDGVSNNVILKGQYIGSPNTASSSQGSLACAMAYKNMINTENPTSTPTNYGIHGPFTINVTPKK